MSPTLPSPTVKEPETLLHHEIDLILKVASFLNSRNHMMIILALNTGLRNEEICSLTVECVQSYQIVPNILMLPGTIAKGGNPRDIPLNPDTRKHLQQFLTWKFKHDEDTLPGAFLFVTTFTHNKMLPRDFQRLIKSISQEAIGRPIHPHILRHTFATRLLSVSNLRIVQKVLGHKNIQTTQIYTHPSNDDISEAINQL